MTPHEPGQLLKTHSRILTLETEAVATDTKKKKNACFLASHESLIIYSITADCVTEKGSFAPLFNKCFVRVRVSSSFVA